MPKNKKGKVVILGGGLAGLSAAYELSKNNYQVVVLEKNAAVGGLARTLTSGKFKFDTGPHRWYTKNSQVDNWMLKMLGDEVIRVPRLTRIYFDKKFFYYPLRLSNALSAMGPVKALMAVLDYVRARISARLFPRKLISMEDGYINQFGRTLYKMFFQRYSEKLWGDDCRNISVDWIGQRSRGLNVGTVIRDAIFKTKNVVSLVDEFSYPQMGVGRIAERLAELTIKHGGEVKVFQDVRVLEHREGKIRSVIAKNKQGKEVINGDYFISSIPINELTKNLRPRVKEEILNHASKLTFRDEVQVTLFVKKAKITSDTWIYVHPKDISFMRYMEMDNWSDRLSPPGTTSIVFEVACNEGDKIWQKSDHELIKMVASDYIREFKFIAEKDIIGGYVHRCPKEYPVYHLGYLVDVDHIKSYLRQFSNLQLIGRNGTFRYNNMDHSVEMGLYAAWNIIEGKEKYDIDSVNIEREYLEEKKLENLEDEVIEEKH